MTKDPTSYFQKLAELLIKAQITNRQGAPLSLDAGLSAAIDIIRTADRAGHKIMFIGNGGSAGIASHQSTDYMKNGGMRALAFNDPALLTCLSNDFGYPHVFEKPVERFADPGDVLMAISSSGRSENILNAAKAAQRKGCHVIGFSGFAPDNPLRALGDINLYIASHVYGFVELAHAALSHYMLDTIIAMQQNET